MTASAETPALAGSPTAPSAPTVPSPPSAPSAPAAPVAAGRRVLVACLAAGVVGAATLPLWRVGAGWVATAIAVGAAGLIARVDRPSGRSEHDGGGVDRWWRIAAAVAGMALISVAAIRAAGWLVAMCLASGVALGSYALAGGATFGALLRSAFALFPAVGPGLSWVASAARRRGTASQSLVWRVVAGLCAGFALLFVFGRLLVSADPRFESAIHGWLKHISVAEVGRVVLALGSVLIVAPAVAYLAGLRRRPVTASTAAVRRRVGIVEWLIPVAMLDVLFGLFVAITSSTLFGGDAYVLGPGGPDYAVYARGGAVQLIVVTVLTLLVVVALAAWAPRSRKIERTLLRVAGGALCLLTLVIVTSALQRFTLYVQAYGFTHQRMFGYVGEVWLGLVFGLLIIAGVQLRASWLPRAVVASAVAVLIGLAAINPEAVMARTHMNRYELQFPLDLGFLTALSPDAADEIAELGDKLGWCQRVASPMRTELSEPDPWYAWNYSREHARAVLAAHPCRPLSG